MLSDNKAAKPIPPATASLCVHQFDKDVVIVVSLSRDLSLSHTTVAGRTAEDQRVGEVLVREWNEWMAAKVKALKAKGRAA